MAAPRAAFSASVFLGSLMAAMTSLNASVSRSMSYRNSSLSRWPSTPTRNMRSRCSSYPFLPAVRFDTMAARAAASAPASEATEPPPGAGESEDSSLANSRRSMRWRRGGFSASTLASMIFFNGSKGVSSARPSDFTAMWMSSSSGTPAGLPWRVRKKAPASSSACFGISPTSSLPVTRRPRISAWRHTSTNTSCTGEIL